MSWKLLLRPEVDLDVAEAVDWYEHREAGLGTAFVAEVAGVMASLCLNPRLNSRRLKNYGWRMTKRFPYKVIYEVQPDANTVVVIAVVHGARHDRHWKRRL